MAKGDSKIDFYTILPELKELYGSGKVVPKRLYEQFHASGKIKMSYQQFMTYFNREIAVKNSPTAEVLAAQNQSPQEVAAAAITQTKEPIKLDIGSRPSVNLTSTKAVIDPKDKI